jgi:hypothetical protein
MAGLALCLVALCFALPACGGGDAGGGTPAAPRPQPTAVATVVPGGALASVVVTEDDLSLPAGCRPGSVAKIVIDALELQNRRLHHGFRLRELIVGYANGLGQIEYKLTPPSEGKGAVDCNRRELVVWTGDRPPVLSTEEVTAPLCPQPARLPEEAVVACVRHW